MRQAEHAVLAASPTERRDLCARLLTDSEFAQQYVVASPHALPDTLTISEAVWLAMVDAHAATKGQCIGKRMSHRSAGQWIDSSYALARALMPDALCLAVEDVCDANDGDLVRIDAAISDMEVSAAELVCHSEKCGDPLSLSPVLVNMAMKYGFLLRWLTRVVAVPCASVTSPGDPRVANVRAVLMNDCVMHAAINNLIVTRAQTLCAERELPACIPDIMFRRGCIGAGIELGSVLRLMGFYDKVANRRAFVSRLNPLMRAGDMEKEEISMQRMRESSTVSDDAMRPEHTMAQLHDSVYMDVWLMAAWCYKFAQAVPYRPAHIESGSDYFMSQCYVTWRKFGDAATMRKMSFAQENNCPFIIDAGDAMWLVAYEKDKVIRCESAEHAIVTWFDIVWLRRDGYVARGAARLPRDINDVIKTHGCV
jgi:hypothetical protein